MLTARVSHLEQFRIWKGEEELSTEWLMHRIRGDEPASGAMLAGTAFHSALEALTSEGEMGTLVSGNYRFDFNCDCEVAIPKIRETRVERQYGNLLVNGTVDAIFGKTVKDYKTTSQFDPDRYMFGYQWRFYLDMMECDTFCWQIFVLKEFGEQEPGEQRTYEVREVHELTQCRYPDMHKDCLELATEYAEFAASHMTSSSGAQNLARSA